MKKAQTKSKDLDKKTNRPSLVVLADGKQTNFQRRRFNPDEFDPNVFYPNHNIDISDGGDDDNYGSDSDPFVPQIDEDDFDKKSSSGYSNEIPTDEILAKLISQLNLSSSVEDLFEDEFKQIDDDDAKKKLGHFGTFQIVKKKNWIRQIWNLFDPFFDEDDENDGEDENGKSKLSNKLPNLLKLFDQMDKNPEEFENSDSSFGFKDPYAYCLYNSAKKTLHDFIISDNGGLNLFMRAAITGPSGSGKSVYLHFIFAQILLFLIEGGRFKEFFIVPFDFQNNKITSIESFYYYISEKVVEAIIIQRPDLQLFQSSLRKAFRVLPTTQKIKHLPKPLSSQDYLRHPLKQLEQVLVRMHHCYNDPKLTDAFLTNVVLLPQTVASIFNFRTAFLVIDHLDTLDIEISQKGKPSVQLLEFVKFGLTMTQYLISCKEGETFSEKLNAMDEDSVDIRSITQNIYVYDTVDSKYQGKAISITFEKSGKSDQPKTFTLTDAHCGGCPNFISKYDKICDRIEEMNNAKTKYEKKEVKVRLMKELNRYIEEMYDFKKSPKNDFDKLPENDSEKLPKITSVEFI